MSLCLGYSDLETVWYGNKSSLRIIRDDFENKMVVSWDCERKCSTLLWCKGTVLLMCAWLYLFFSVYVSTCSVCCAEINVDISSLIRVLCLMTSEDCSTSVAVSFLLWCTQAVQTDLWNLIVFVLTHFPVIRSVLHGMGMARMWEIWNI